MEQNLFTASVLFVHVVNYAANNKAHKYFIVQLMHSII